jgi:methionyl-tRNA formyltransferase
MPFPSPWGHPEADLAGRPVGIAKASLTGTPAVERPGTVHGVTEAGAAVATRNELILVERFWLEGRYIEPRKLLAD